MARLAKNGSPQSGVRRRPPPRHQGRRLARQTAAPTASAPNAATSREQGRELAIRVQDELGTDSWEVLYRLGDRMFRVQPPGSWPAGTWQQELLGYAPRDRHDAEGG